VFLGPLFSAIKYQKTEAVECLLKAGTRTVDVNLQDKAGMTALHHASKESYRYLLLVSGSVRGCYCSCGATACLAY
jgi:ankyrin repeat protein